MNDQSLIDYFTRIDSREGIFLWMAMLVAFLFGFLIAYLLRSGKVRRLKKENKQLRADLEAAETQNTSLQEQLKERNIELQEESREKVELMDRVARLEREREEKLQEVVVLNQRLEDLQGSNRSYEQKLHLLQGQLEEQGPSDSGETSIAQQFSADSATMGEVIALQDRLTAFETTLGRLQEENKQLRAGLHELKDHKHSEAEITKPGESEIEEPEEVLIETKKTVLYDKIIVPDREQDDLTKIDGLGDFLAKKLNSNGIFSYAEIASWTPDRINAVTDMIGYIPGRIVKDDWVGQAALLLQAQTNSDTPSTRSLKEEAPKKKKKNKSPKGIKEGDLKIIEGVGPKIETVLKNAGINDWAMLAATEPGRLKEILEEAGDRFRMHNPYTWPLQARLAAAGRWEEFTSYQEELKGGKES